MQWLQHSNQSNSDNLNNTACEASRHFRNKKREYLKAKMNELERISKDKYIKELYRGIIDFKKSYQPRTSIVKDEKSDLVTDSHSILTRWRNYFSQLLNVHGNNDVKQTEIHTAERLVPEPSAFEVEKAIEKLKRYKSLGIDQIPAELIKAGGSKICPAIHKLINSIWNKEDLPEQWKVSIIVPIYKKGDNTDCSDCHSVSLLSTTYKFLPIILLSRLTAYAEEIVGNHQCGF
jgi:hypothetical protein